MKGLLISHVGYLKVIAVRMSSVSRQDRFTACKLTIAMGHLMWSWSLIEGHAHQQCCISTLTMPTSFAASYIAFCVLLARTVPPVAKPCSQGSAFVLAYGCKVFNIAFKKLKK
jgi:hypothetical protein